MTASSPVWPVRRSASIPKVGDEKDLLVAYLAWYRETFALKCAGVEDRLSERSMPPSTMSLHGLLRHLAGVERWWFRINFAGEDVPLLFFSDDDPDQDFEDLGGDVDEALATWRDECARADAVIAAAALGDTRSGPGSAEPFSLRWLLLRMITEYAQHDGHADLLRQGIDGATGA